MNIEGIEIERLNHASFKIKKGKVIYIDPFHINENEKADIILISHGHYDHCSIEDINKVIDNTTILVATHDCLSKLTRFKNNKINIIKPKSKFVIDNIKIETVAAYNVNKFRAPGIPFHSKEEEWVGYILEIADKRIYFVGDSDVIKEMSDIKNIDIMLIPVSGTYVMTAREAVDAVNIIKPKIAVPMHYGAGVAGTLDDAKRFKELVKGTNVEIL